MKTKLITTLVLVSLMISLLSISAVKGQEESSYSFTTIDFPGAASTILYGINDVGQIVGSYGCRGFLFDNGSFQTIDFPGAKCTEAWGINNGGQIVGGYVTEEDPEDWYGFLYDGSFQTIMFPGSDETYAFGINDAGQIVGHYGKEGWFWHGFLFDGSGFQTIKVPYSGCECTAAHGINNVGQAVGSYWGSECGEGIHGFLFDGGFQAINFPDAVSTAALGINDRGQIVGNYSGYSGWIPSQIGIAFLYDNGTFQTLNFPYFTSVSAAYDINNAGQLVGSYRDLYGQLHGFLATPVVSCVTVLLTFDDGPEGDEYRFNSTSSVLNTLSTNSVQEGIKATFFTLTHGQHWGGSELGANLLYAEYANGHVVSIHQGGKGCKGPHVNQPHTKRVDTFPYPVGACGEVLKKGEGEPVGKNGLESDLVAAIRRLRCLFLNSNYNPEFVRPPMYIYNASVLDAYNSQAVKCELGNCDGDGLKMILTDNKGTGDSGGPGPLPSVVSETLKRSVKNCLQQKIYEIVLTLHDSNDTTARNLNRYLNDIRQAAEEEGFTIKFVESESEAREILNRRWIAGNWQGN